MNVAFDFDQNGHLIQPKSAARANNILELRAMRKPPAPPSHPAPLPAPLVPQPKPSDLTLDRSRDALLTNFGKATLTDRYLLPGESFQDMFARVSCAFADDIPHAQR